MVFKKDNLTCTIPGEYKFLRFGFVAFLYCGSIRLFFKYGVLTLILNLLCIALTAVFGSSNQFTLFMSIALCAIVFISINSYLFFCGQDELISELIDDGFEEIGL